MSFVERAPADDGTGRTSLVGPVLGCLLLGGLTLLLLIPVVRRLLTAGD